MQLQDLVKPIDEMTDEELRARLREIRHKREIVRPAAKKHIERAKKKGAVTRINKAAELFAGMSEEEKAELIKALEG
jgi:uncharacterized tellurite resistance protein B-like protein